jgi:hypothetical protein
MVIPSLCINSFKIKEILILLTHCVYGSRTILRTNIIIYPNSINRLVFVNGTHSVFCEPGTAFLNITYTNFCLKN